ncbi:hypothetical protein GQR58_018014 [Nymphon striatum]|nr:hypothetical protein GQR58_018014 [Nymphon striatum]
MRVVAARRADSESEEGKKTVERRIRGQGNFVEYVPITLILFALLEMGGFNSLILGLIALVFAFARTIHGYAFSFTDHWSFGRFYGTLITFVVIGLLGDETMKRWVIIFKDTIEMLEIRATKELRDAHVAFAKAHPELLIGGGLKPDIEGDFCGALWIVEAESKAQVEQLIAKDPFYFPEHRQYEVYTWGKLLEDQTAVL